jgi:branched-chain amino acid aminotransferase
VARLKIWLNGALLDAADARIDPADRGLLLGDGVFETVRVEAGRPWHLALHIARLRAGAAVLGFEPPACLDAAGDAARKVAGRLPWAALRITLTRGPAPRGVPPPADPRPTLLITAAELPLAAPPARAILATVTRRNEHSPLSRIKSLNYLDSILARQEAASSGAHEAILLNTAGRIAEASASNLFVRFGTEWVTPPVAEGALPGVARGLILGARLACEAPIEVGQLAGATAAFTSSSLGLRALSHIGDAALAAPELVGFLAAVRG